jgi:4-amino-4-deoxy-L-arabinose transferase-like glycosyltransferase
MSFSKLKEIIRDRRFKFALLYGLLALVIIYVMTSGGLGVTFDSERYLVTAHYLKQAKLGDALMTAFAGSPLFYPISILALKILGLSDWLTGARIISILTYIVSVIVTFLLGLQIQGKPTAHLSALTMLIFAPMVCTFSYCWSETLYIMLSFLFVIMLIFFLNSPPGKTTRYFIGMTVFAGLGFFTRYLGFSMIMTGIFSFWYFKKHDSPSKKIKNTLVFGFGSGLLMLIGFVLYYIHLNTLFGERIPAKYSLSEQLIHFFTSIHNDFFSFGLTFERYEVLLMKSQLWDEFSSIWFLAGKIILVCLLILLVFFIKSVRSSKQFCNQLKSQVAVFSYIAMYGLLLLGITSTMFVEQAGTRFNVPLYPFIILSIFSMTFHFYGTLTAKKARIFFLGMVIACTAFFWGIQFVTTSNFYERATSGTFPAVEHPGNRNRASLKFLQENVDSTATILTNIPFKMGFIWPRKNPYRGLNLYTPNFTIVGTTSIERYLSRLLEDEPDLRIYLYLCSRDYPNHIFQAYNVDELDNTPGYFSWKKVIGNEYIFKLADDPKIPEAR